jgi:multicomponent Na+:H+ antiporter subunit D
VSEPLIDLLISQRPLLAVLVSLAVIPLILCSQRRPNLREGWTLTAAFVKFAIIVSMISQVTSGEILETSPLLLAPGIKLYLRVDAFGLLFAVVASGLWLLTSFYSIGYMRRGQYTNQTSYFVSFAICLSATIGIAFAGNLLTFFIFYEILTLATYPLVVHRRTPEALAAGKKYLIYTLGAGQIFLLAILWIEVIAPGSDFTPGGFLYDHVNSGVLPFIFLLFMIGTGVKAGIMPLHGWLPAAMVAPTPVSALLHAVAVVKAGVFGVVRIVGYVFGTETLRIINADVVLATIAAISILLASIRALGEVNLKRRLAYSTLGQLSYIVLGAALGSVTAIMGAMFYIAAHAVMKITLFFCAGSIYIATKRTEIADLGGLGRSMPITMGAFAIGAVGLTGLPLLVGFIGKWNIGLGALDANLGIFIAVLLISGILNFAYFFPILYIAFYGHSNLKPGKEPGIAIVGPLVLTALLTIILGIAPNAGLELYSLASQAAQDVATHVVAQDWP